jgi:hypothetical protein
MPKDKSPIRNAETVSEMPKPTFLYSNTKKILIEIMKTSKGLNELRTETHPTI